MAYNLLKGKRGIIFGALNEDSIAWKVAERAFSEGARFTLTNAPIAMRMGEINKLSEACNAPIIPADVTSLEELENLFDKSMEALDTLLNQNIPAGIVAEIQLLPFFPLHDRSFPAHTLVIIGKEEDEYICCILRFYILHHLFQHNNR